MRALAAAALCAIASAAAAAPGDGARETLSVAAAANLKVAIEALARAFEAERPGVRVAVTTGASGTFVAQLESGAPLDVFFSADREYPRRLVTAGRADGAEVVYAIGRLAAWAPAASRLDLAGRGLAALADGRVRKVAIANPAVAPYGRAAAAALEAAGVAAAVRPKLVLGQNVAQAAQFAESGAADAAIVPLSLALAGPLAGGDVFAVPASLHPALEQAAVVLRGAKDPALARAFLAFATGAKGRAILARHGYALPG